MNGKSGNVAFLVGAGRSGTTLLYKLLCLHPKVAYISNYESRTDWIPYGVASRLTSHRLGAKVNSWFDRGRNASFTQRPLRKRIFPTPAEGEAVYERRGIPLFPRQGDPAAIDGEGLRGDFDKIRRRMGAEIMLSKRTANNRRIPILESIFPEARYVHVIRDGREVADSLTKVDWWRQHVLWWDGRTAEQLERCGEERLAIAARNWAYEMNELQKGLASVPPDRILEVRYDQVLSDPVGQMHTILRFLGVRPTEEYEDAILSLRLYSRPSAWQTRWSADQLEMVMREVRPLLHTLGYV